MRWVKNLSKEEQLGPKPTVIAELEDWDSTTDVIVWLIQKKYADVLRPTLELEKTPKQKYNRNDFEFLTTQTATLDGSKIHEGVKLRFDAMYAELKDNDESVIDGYKVEVCMQEKEHFRWIPIAKYTISGADREDFEIREEKTEQKSVT